MSLGWEYTIMKRNQSIRDNHFILERDYRKLFIQIMGTQRFYLIPPKQDHLIKRNITNNQIVSQVNFWDKKQTSEEPFNKVEYIEIILREGNILFIPKGWWYLRANQSNTLIMEANNLSILSFLKSNI